MSKLENFWDTFWLEEVEPHALAFTRICFGLFLLVYAGLYVPHLDVLFSNQGLVLPLYLDRFPSFAWALAPHSPAVTHVIYGVFLLCIVGITVGYKFRASVFGTIVIALYLWQLQLHIFPTSYNRILLLCLIVFLFSGAHRTMSLDQKKRSGSFWDWEPISVLPQRLITVQITCTFLGVSLQKWWLPHWKGGEILAYSYISRWSTPLGRWYAQLPFTLLHYDSIVWVVKFVQPITAAGLWIPRIRTVSVLFLSAFILLVSVMLSIWWFVFIIPAFCLFYRPKVVFDIFRSHLPDRICPNAVKMTK